MDHRTTDGRAGGAGSTAPDGRGGAPAGIHRGAAATTEAPQGPLVAEHGSAKQAEPTDPLQLTGTAVAGGDPDYLARCLVEELAGMGHGADEILSVFRDPGYLAPHAFYRLRGDAAVRDLIEEVLAECGVFRVTEHRREPTPRCPKLYQIELSPFLDAGVADGDADEEGGRS